MIEKETKDFVSRFKGKFDTFDSFRILKSSGKVEGDCDDFAVTMLWIAEGRSLRKFWSALLTGRAVIWRTYADNGNPHAALWHKNYGWIDSTKPFWRKDPLLKLRYKRSVFRVAIKMLIGKFI